MCRRRPPGRTTPDAGFDRIRAIERADPEYGPGLDAAMFALCGLAFGVILGISWLDVLLGGVLSIVSFGIVSLAARSRGLTTALELVVAAVAAALATLLPLVRVPRRCGPFMWGSRWGSSKGCGQCPTSSC